MKRRANATSALSQDYNLMSLQSRSVNFSTVSASLGTGPDPRASVEVERAQRLSKVRDQYRSMVESRREDARVKMKSQLNFTHAPNQSLFGSLCNEDYASQPQARGVRPKFKFDPTSFVKNVAKVINTSQPSFEDLLLQAHFQKLNSLPNTNSMFVREVDHAKTSHAEEPSQMFTHAGHTLDDPSTAMHLRLSSQLRASQSRRGAGRTTVGSSLAHGLDSPQARNQSAKMARTQTSRHEMQGGQPRPKSSASFLRPNHKQSTLTAGTGQRAEKRLCEMAPREREQELQPKPRCNFNKSPKSRGSELMAQTRGPRAFDYQRRQNKS